MANWVRDFLAENPELSNRVVKRARHALHTRNDDGTITARFTGTPMHYQDERGEWQAIDTAIRRLPNGKLGAPGIPIEFDDDGQVNLEGYSQVTRRVGIYNANAGEFVQAFDLPTPKIDDDKLVRETGIYKHIITLKEAGLREELIIKEKPAQPVDTKLEDKTNLWLVLDTTITGQEFEDGLVDDDAKYEKGEFKFVPPKAGDANDNELSVKRHARKIEGKQHLLTGVRLDVLNDAVYPVTIDPDFTGGTADGYISGGSSLYSTARSTSGAGYQAAKYMDMGQYYSGTVYYVWRVFVLFDTSSIPDSANITQVNLKLTASADYSNTDFDVQIVKTDWSSNTDFSNTTQRENAYDNCLADDADDSIWRNTSGMSTYTPYTSGNLSTAWVNKTGTTYYGLRSNRDKSAIAPSGNEYVRLSTQESLATTDRPVLVVTYTEVTAYTLACAAGSYSLTGTACTLTAQFNYVLSCSSATYTLTGTDAGFEIHHTLAIDGGSYALAGVDVGLNRGYTLSADAGSYALVGVDVTFTRGYTLSAGVGSYAQTGTDLSFVLRRNYTLSANAGSYETIGSDILFEIRRNYILSLEAGSYLLTGVDVALISARTLSVEAGSYAITGTGIGLHRGYTLSCGVGSYALAGIGAGLHRGYSLSVIAGSYTLTGVDIAFEVLQHNYIIGLDAGEYTLTGKDAILTSARTLSVDAGDYTLSGTEASLKSERILSADAGSYILTGTEAGLHVGYALSAGAGSYILTGADCTLTPQFNYTLALEAGSYTLTGIDIVLQRGFILSVDSGAYTLVGLDVSLLVGGIIIAEAGTYILTGSDATFLFTMITPVCRTLVIDAESRTLVIEAENRTLVIEACKDGG